MPTRSNKPRISQTKREQLGYNPNRTNDLFALTTDGYIIAQDISSQYEYVATQPSPATGGPLIAIAHINRSFQGLSELVALCPGSGERFSFIFDISNDVFQGWLAERMGDLYEPSYDGPARVADHDQRSVTE